MTGLGMLVGLLFGWFAFVLRVFPQVTIRWDGITIFCVAFLISLCCARSFLNWLSSESLKSDLSSAPRWSWVATGTLLAMILLVFVVGISLIGITHQAIWLGTSPDLWSESVTQSAADSARSNYQPGTVDQQEFAGNWVTAIMPFSTYTLDDFGRSPVHSELPWNSPENAPLFRRPMPDLINPSLEVPSKSLDGFGLSHFAGNANVFQGTPKRLDELDDNTMLVAEVNAGFVPWGHPNMCRDLHQGLRSDWLQTPNTQPLGFGPVRGSDTVLMLLLDNSTREVSVNADPTVLRQLSGSDE
ncbi:MAG: hypothetical protein H8E66_10670 [Planctomycetes bacterium]|nr:hypothetical protein [Planctomycetota bacterium]